MFRRIFILFAVPFALLQITACNSYEESMEATYEFRRNAVKSQIDNLEGNIRTAYNDNVAVMGYLDTFIRDSPNVHKATLTSVPLAQHPLCVNLTEVKTGHPKPVGKYCPMVKFGSSEDM
jgi:hypothetical protein